MTDCQQGWLQPALLPEALPALDRSSSKKIQTQRSKRTSQRTAQTTKQPLLLQSAVPKSISQPVCPPQTEDLRDRSPVELPPPAPKPLPKDWPKGWVDPTDPSFNDLKNCYQCGAPIQIGGLDHSLCSGHCGWVVDRIWKQRQDELDAAKKRRRGSTVEVQAATHQGNRLENSEIEPFDLFTSEADGGEL